MNADFPKDKYEIPRCHHVSSTGATCNAPPLTGEHYCFFHHPDRQEQRHEAQRNGGFNRRQPEPPPRIPPNLPYVKLETRAHIQLVYEVTMNYVMQGQMDLRVANTIGYLAMGALATLDSQARVERQAAGNAAKKATEAAAKAAAAEAAKTAPDRGSSGRKHPIATLYMTNPLTGDTEIIRNGQTTIVPGPRPVNRDQPPHNAEPADRAQPEPPAGSAKTPQASPPSVAAKIPPSPAKPNNASVPASPPAKQDKYVDNGQARECPTYWKY